MILVRVYGILLNEKQELLISHEQYGKHRMTKFPGGGLEYGEGTMDCLIREFKEELSIDITVKSHFYTTDFFQKSAYHKKAQVLSIYYLVESTKHPIEININDEHIQSIEFVSVEKLNETSITLPIDRLVLNKIKKYLKCL